MNIHYRIVKVDPAAHGVLVRYWTDKVTEMDLAGPIDADGKPLLNADGYPVGCRTDVLLTLYETPTPSAEEIDKRIMMSAPVDFLKLQEDIKDRQIDTSMKAVRNLVGDSKAFTLNEVNDVRLAAAAQETAIATANMTEEQTLSKAYEVIGSITDSIKILSKKDPAILTVLIAALNSIKPTN